MLFFVICTLLAALLLVPIILFMDSRPATIPVWRVRAGSLEGSGDGGDLCSIIIRKNLKLTDSNGASFDLSLGRYQPMFTTGNSMERRGIEKGSLVLVDTFFQACNLLEKDIVALTVVEEHHGDMIGENKLRLFDHIGLDDSLGSDEMRFHVREFKKDTKDDVECKWTHPASGYLGKVAAHFSAIDSARIIATHGQDEKVAA